MVEGEESPPQSNGVDKLIEMLFGAWRATKHMGECERIIEIRRRWFEFLEQEKQ